MPFNERIIPPSLEKTMDIKTQLVAAVVRALSDKTTLIHKPDSFSEAVSVFLNGKTYDQRIAEDLVADAEKFKRAVRNRPRRGYHRITTIDN